MQIAIIILCFILLAAIAALMCGVVVCIRERAWEMLIPVAVYITVIVLFGYATVYPFLKGFL